MRVITNEFTLVGWGGFVWEQSTIRVVGQQYKRSGNIFLSQSNKVHWERMCPYRSVSDLEGICLYSHTHQLHNVHNSQGKLCHKIVWLEGPGMAGSGIAGDLRLLRYKLFTLCLIFKQRIIEQNPTLPWLCLIAMLYGLVNILHNIIVWKRAIAV